MIKVCVAIVVSNSYFIFSLIFLLSIDKIIYTIIFQLNSIRADLTHLLISIYLLITHFANTCVSEHF